MDCSNGDTLSGLGQRHGRLPSHVIIMLSISPTSCIWGGTTAIRMAV